MTKKTNKLNPRSILNQRIIYTRGGQREGWQGFILSLIDDQKSIVVRFDNGMDQKYHLGSLQGFEFPNSQYGTYLKLLPTNACAPAPCAPAPCAPDPFGAPFNSPKPVVPFLLGKVLAIKFDGSVLESFNDEYEATAFCLEQVESTSGFEKFHIFNLSKTIQSEVPAHVTLTADGKVVDA